MSNEALLEQRLAVVEASILDLRRRIAALSGRGRSIDALIGSISDDAAFEEALHYGREIRAGRLAPESLDDRA